ncbi:MAG: GNAT family N-acetyltransferase [Myxococcota bacterium]
MDVEPVTLEGRTVRLEPLAESHAADLAEAASEDLFAYHFPPAELTAEGFGAQIAGLRSTPGWLPFATVLRETGRAVGMTSYLDIRPPHRGLEIGFTWIGRPWQGTAVNPEAKLLQLRHAFEALLALRVQLKTDARNLQSQAALEKLGAKREGTLRKHMVLADGHVRDTVMFSITDDDWPAVRAGLERRLQEA